MLCFSQPGYVSGRSADSEAPLREPFLKSLQEAGFVAGRNVTIEYRYAQGRDERLPELASELVRRQVAVLVATSNTSALAVKAATSTNNSLDQEEARREATRRLARRAPAHAASIASIRFSDTLLTARFTALTVNSAGASGSPKN